MKNAYLGHAIEYMDLGRVNDSRVVDGADRSEFLGWLIVSRISRERVNLIADEMNSFGGAKMQQRL